MKYVTFIILNKILINIPYSLLLFLNIFLTYFAISGYLSQITVRKQKRMIASYSYCPLYRATFTPLIITLVLLHYHLFSQKSLIMVQKVGQPIIL